MRTFLTILLCTLFYSGFSFGTDWNVYVAKYRHDKVCAISYTFDDGLAEHYTLAAPQLEQRGFRGTFFVNGSNLFTLCNRMLRNADPEREERDWGANLAYPLMRSYNFGLNINF